MSRSLPKKGNPLIRPDVSPSYQELVNRRRLGSTYLKVKQSQMNTSNATKAQNLGAFEYAHLRAPLPQDLRGSEVFPHNTKSRSSRPETYFLMRRSEDGYVSATGMFKIAFPWARQDDERLEREYLKTRELTSHEEIAGNIWISPLLALELAKDYKMYHWVRALLDEAVVAQSTSKEKDQPIVSQPPTFVLPEDERSPTPPRRSRRSVSPVKSTPMKSFTPGRGMAARRAVDVFDTPSTGTAAANDNLQSSLDDSAANLDAAVNGHLFEVSEETEVKSAGSPKKSRARKSKKGTSETDDEKEAQTEKEARKAEKKAKKAAKAKEALEEVIEEEVEGELEDTPAIDSVEVSFNTTEKVLSLDVPLLSSGAPSAEETQEMIATAKKMVEDAIKADQAEAGSSSKVAKRKPVEDDEENSAESEQRSKRTKVLEEKIVGERKSSVRSRAAIGATIGIALATTIPYFFM